MAAFPATADSRDHAPVPVRRPSFRFAIPSGGGCRYRQFRRRASRSSGCPGAALTVARQRGIAAVGVTFEPHPRDVFRPEHPVFRLTPAPVKARLVEAIGLDGLVSIPFLVHLCRPESRRVRGAGVGGRARHPPCGRRLEFPFRSGTARHTAEASRARRAAWLLG